MLAQESRDETGTVETAGVLPLTWHHITLLQFSLEPPLPNDVTALLTGVLPSTSAADGTRNFIQPVSNLEVRLLSQTERRQFSSPALSIAVCIARCHVHRTALTEATRKCVRHVESCSTGAGMYSCRSVQWMHLICC